MAGVPPRIPQERQPLTLALTLQYFLSEPQASLSQTLVGWGTFFTSLNTFSSIHVRAECNDSSSQCRVPPLVQRYSPAAFLPVTQILVGEGDTNQEPGLDSK